MGFQVVVVLDLREVDRVAEARGLEQIARIGALGRCLVLCEAHRVHPGVEAAEHALHDLVHLRAQLLGHRFGAPSRWCSAHSKNRSSTRRGWSFVTTRPLGTSTTVGNGDALGGVGEASQEGVLEARDAEHRVQAVRVQVERPRVLVVRGPGEREGDRALESQQAADDHGAVGPRAGARGDQAKAASFHGPLRIGVGRCTRT